MLCGDKRGRWTKYFINKYYDKESIYDKVNFSVDEYTSLNKTDKLIYRFVCEHGMITTKKVLDIVDTIKTTQGASVAINRLLEKNLIKKNEGWKNNILY